MKTIFMMTKVPDIIFFKPKSYILFPVLFLKTTIIIPELWPFVFRIYSQPIVFKVCFFEAAFCWDRFGPLIPSHSHLTLSAMRFVSLRKYWWRSFEATLSETVHSRWRWDRLSILRRMGGVSCLWHPKNLGFRLNSFQKIRWHSHTLKGYVTARWWFPIFFIFTPKKRGRWTYFDEHIFQMGWFNHQLDWWPLGFTMSFNTSMSITGRRIDPPSTGPFCPSDRG